MLVCPETKQGVWIGQGNGGMKSLYSGEEETMEFLRRFLVETQGKELKLIDEYDDTWADYDHYEKLHCRVCIYGNKFEHFCGQIGKNIGDDELKADLAPSWCPLKKEEEVK